MIPRTFIIFAISILLFMTSHATAEQAKSGTIDWQSVSHDIVTQAILPTYNDFLTTAQAYEQHITRLCQEPSEDNWKRAKEHFTQLVTTFAAVSVIRFGPIRQQTRLERLMFWPDPRGAGIRQVQSLLQKKDQRALDTTTLAEKSAAVQGLIPQEYLLYGRSAGDLLSAGNFRCQYAQTSATLITQMAQNTRKDWMTYQDVAFQPGPENPEFKTHAEVGRRIIGSMVETLTALSEKQVKAVLKDSHDKARPKLSPFWRSNLSAPYQRAVLASLLRYIELPAWQTLQIRDVDYAWKLVRSELDFADRALAEAEKEAWTSYISTEQNHRKLRNMAFNLDGALTHIVDTLQPALGLTSGFNSLDGD